VAGAQFSPSNGKRQFCQRHLQIQLRAIKQSPHFIAGPLGFKDLVKIGRALTVSGQSDISRLVCPGQKILLHVQQPRL
jgi:hypothetical protein